MRPLFEPGLTIMTKENIEPLRQPSAPETSRGDAAATLTLNVPRAIDLNRVATRREHDLLGEAEVPAEAYWAFIRFARSKIRNSSAPLPSLSRRRRAPTGGSSNWPRRRRMPSTTPAISSPRTGATSTNSWSMRYRAGPAPRPI